MIGRTRCPLGPSPGRKTARALGARPRIGLIRPVRLLVALGLLALAASVTAWACQRYYGLPKRFAVLEKGVLFRSGQPRTGEVDHLIEKLGLRSIVIAREGSEKVRREKTHAEHRGLKLFHLPLESRRPIPAEQIDAFFKVVDDSQNHPVLVHCSAGRHRAGLLCALYRIERQGWSVEQAVAEMRSFDPEMEPDRPELQQLRRYQPKR